MDWTNSFMQPEIYEGDYFEVETSMGTDTVPADVLMPEFVAKLARNVRYTEDDHIEGRRLVAALRQFCEAGDLYEATLKHGFLGRLSAPGYLDCTEWTAHATEDEAIAYLDQMFGDES